MKTRQTLLMVAAAFVLIVGGRNMSAAQTGETEGLAPWADNTNPTDVPRQHVEMITAPRYEYAVAQGGTMDGENCRQPIGVWHAYPQRWESNRAVRMENIGDTDVVNPWLSNGRNNYRTIPEIIRLRRQLGRPRRALAGGRDQGLSGIPGGTLHLRGLLRRRLAPVGRRHAEHLPQAG